MWTWEWVTAFIVCLLIAAAVAGFIINVLSPRGFTSLAARLGGLVAGVIVFFLIFGSVYGFVRNIDAPDVDVDVPKVDVDLATNVPDTSGEDLGTCTVVLGGQTTAPVTTTRDQCEDDDGTFVHNGSAGAGATANVGTGFVSPTPNTVAPQTTTQQPAAPTTAPAVQDQGNSCSFNLPRTIDHEALNSEYIVEEAPRDAWFHRLWDKNLFHAPDWAGSDTWFMTYAILHESGGSFISHGNKGEIVFRGNSTELEWCLAIMTTEQYKGDIDNGYEQVAVNIQIAPNTPVDLIDANGNVLVTQNTSDQGDLTITLPNSGVIAIHARYHTDAPTDEAEVWFGPYDRSDEINTLHGEEHQW